MTDKLYLEAEQTVLGSMLIDPDCVPEILYRVRAEDFIHDDCRAVFETAKTLFSEGTAVSALTIGARAGDGILQYCRELREITPSSAVWPDYVKILKDGAAQARALTLVEGLRLDLTQGAPRETLMEQAQALVETLSDNTHKGSFTLAQLLTQVMADMGREKTYLDWGFDKLNRHIFAEGGEYIILAARPSVGKTAFALQVGMHFSQKKRVTFFSLETDEKKTGQRILTAQSGVDFRAIKAGSVDAAQMTDLAKTCRALQNHRFDYQDAAGWTVEDIRAHIMRTRAEIVVIDYLQLLCHHNLRLDEYARVSDVSRQLQRLCKDLHVTILALSQLSRIGEYEEPDMSHLRSSGQLEQDADVILMMYKPDPADARTKDEAEDAENRRWLKIAKNKEGVVGKIRMWFNGRIQRFAQEWEHFYDKPEGRLETPDPGAKQKKMEGAG